MTINFQRFLAMPSADTFDCQPIGDFVKKYLRQSKVSVDPFARNKRWATYTNDLNPNTAAEYHLDALDFLKMLRERGVMADLVIFDPPYSPRQFQECYEGVGLKMSGDDAWRTSAWTAERDLIGNLVGIGGYVLSFGWNSMGMGKRGFDILEILMVNHGAAHNDTICMAERKAAEQLTLAELPEAAS